MPKYIGACVAIVTTMNINRMNLWIKEGWSISLDDRTIKGSNRRASKTIDCLVLSKRIVEANKGLNLIAINKKPLRDIKHNRAVCCDTIRVKIKITSNIIIRRGK